MEVGSRVKTTGLNSNPELNDLVGVILALDVKNWPSDGTNRWKIKMDADGSKKSFKEKNLILLSGPSSDPWPSTDKPTEEKSDKPADKPKESEPAKAQPAPAPSSSSSGDLWVGDRVITLGLNSTPELNDLTAVILELDLKNKPSDGSNRWKIKLDKDGSKKSMKEKNLKKISGDPWTKQEDKEQ